MTTDIDRPMQAAATVAGRGRRKPGLWRKALKRFLTYLEKRETRWSLRELTDDQLLDIGMTRAEARTEVNKSWFWG
ncbi:MULTISPECIES: DUF1127 domain-containing protein [Rhizobium]|uniref:DUF1127 domain-containing protein n=1 Tax=Rhizobium tropici TaxID=398 RepID=A0A6P1CCA7_RHITR|nr:MULTISPECIES: DUF1127 domain-containing protein [Rhizobium]MBB4245153.1 uncharacterized protein YjiS (DUF1127 family) [Rhizobium tropici]MBB5596564.1 uncharacterized protein YjiS (DUF1127 family) [Rhizobium tropici]MBB6495540.1 uncharacterized protein YjiS (DUF1127 family) [Rhizobium tropici]NEV14698.1 DUF1127 domain-containing protein [Rhizobium tropici]TGE89793.1 DUF1127 domain-containing protein [Rhizobium sp. SEMIA 4088]